MVYGFYLGEGRYYYYFPFSCFSSGFLFSFSFCRFLLFLFCLVSKVSLPADVLLHAYELDGPCTYVARKKDVDQPVCLTSVYF